jgi:hypothetical protein
MQLVLFHTGWGLYWMWVRREPIDVATGKHWFQCHPFVTQIVSTSKVNVMAYQEHKYH